MIKFFEINFLNLLMIPNRAQKWTHDIVNSEIVIIKSVSGLHMSLDLTNLLIIILYDLINHFNYSLNFLKYFKNTYCTSKRWALGAGRVKPFSCFNDFYWRAQDNILCETNVPLPLIWFTRQMNWIGFFNMVKAGCKCSSETASACNFIKKDEQVIFVYFVDF